MAMIDARMSDYFQRFIVPIAAVFIGLRILVFVLRKIHPIFYVFMDTRWSLIHHKVIEKQKKKLFAEVNMDSLREENKRLFAMEIACGPGRNFGFYPPKTSLTVVEPNVKFQKVVAENAANHPSVEITRFLTVGAEDLREYVDNNSQDVVVCTLAMCSVRDITAVVREARRVLKPGGHFYFIDHTEFPDKKSWAYFFQRIQSVYLYRFFGCNPHHKSWVHVEKAGFSRVKFTRMVVNSPRLLHAFKPHVFGYAVK